MQWKPDRGLQLRMGVAVLLLLVMPLAFVYTLHAAFTTVVVPLSAVLFESDLAWELSPSLPAMLGVTLVGLTAQFLLGERVAWHAVGARRVRPDDRPELYARLGRLAQQAGVSTPTLAVAPSSVPNAFATGRSTTAATVVVTEGLLEALDDDELDAVLAHELAHVKNRDVAVMSVAYLLPSFTYVVAVGTYSLLGGLWNVVGHIRHSDVDDARPLVAVVVLFVVSAALTILISALFWVGSFLLFRVLAQYREHAADRGAARITGDPLALASALRTLDATLTSLPDRDLRALDGGVEALYVAPLDVAKFTDGDDGLISRDLFPESHPPTADRIERLTELAGELERT